MLEKVTVDDLIHDIQHIFLQNGAKTSGSSVLLQCLGRNRVKRILLIIQLHLIQGKELLILFQNCILRFLQDLHQHILIQSVQRIY